MRRYWRGWRNLRLGSGQARSGAVELIVEGQSVYLLLGDVIDFGAEAERLRQRLASAAGEIAKLEARLGDRRFIDNAPADVVETARARLADTRHMHDRLSAALAQPRLMPRP